MLSIVNNSFSSWIIDELNKRGLSQAELSRRSGISAGAISHVINGNRQPGIDFCEGIAKAFHLPVEQIFRLAGIFPQSQDDEYSKEAAHLVSLMPDDMKQTAVRYLRYLVAESEAERK
jgi:transcriptional regulator with XRE-family HTH domain